MYVYEKYKCQYENILNCNFDLLVARRLCYYYIFFYIYEVGFPMPS